MEITISNKTPNFYQKTYTVVCQIPAGKVATYGQIAMLAGNPRASRAVGYALHRNPMPGIIPCHRVVNREGRPAPAFAFGGAGVQQSMLEQEGVVFNRDGSVVLKKHLWQPGEETMPADLRVCKDAEIPKALQLVRKVFDEFEAPDYSQEGTAEFYRFLENTGEMKKLAFFGAFQQERLIGVLALRQQHIALFFVKKEYRHRGIGKALFCEMMRQTQYHPKTVNSSPYAVEIYRRFGFSAVGPEQVENGIRYTPMAYSDKTLFPEVYKK